MKLVFGGTFDPVHLGHLRMATELAAALEENTVWLMPCHQPVHKGHVSASASQRLAMLNLIAKADPVIQIDCREIERQDLSFTIDSLTELRSELGEQESLALVMGSDAATAIHTWKNIDSFASLTNLIILKRPGFTDFVDFNLLDELGFTRVNTGDQLKQQPSGHVFELELTPLEISSSQIRDLLKQNQSARYLMTGDVWTYICDNALYTQHN